MLRIATAAFVTLAALPVSAQGVDLRAASVALSYEDGTEGNNLGTGRARVAIGVDLGFGDRFGMTAELGYLSNDSSGGTNFDYKGLDLFLNPYWQTSDGLRIGLFYDTTQLNSGSTDFDSDLYGLTIDHIGAGGLMIDGYLGAGTANRFDLDATVLGVALNYDFSNGWAVGGHLDYEELTGSFNLDNTRIGLAGSYSFQGSTPVTVTLSTVYEDTDSNDTRFGLEFSIPIGPDAGPARPADPRRGIFGGRPLS